MIREFIQFLTIVLLLNLSSYSLACPYLPKAFDLPDDYPELENVLTQIKEFQTQKNTNQKGGTITGIVYKNKVLPYISTGFSNKSLTDIPPTLKTVYRICSITKLYMATLVMILRDEGKLNLDDPIKKFIPEFKIYNPLNFTSSITIKQMLAHLAGLPRNMPCDFYDCEVSTKEILDRMANNMTMLTGEANTQALYSNLGYAWIGYVLEKASNISMKSLLYEKITKPLKMENTGINITDNIKSKLATGYANNEEVTKVSSLGWALAAGDMYSTAEDMMKYAADLVSGSILFPKASTKREFWKPEIIQKDLTGGFGLSWEFEYDESNQMWLKGKSGALIGYTAQLYIIPEMELATISLSTSGIGSLMSSFAVKKMANLLKKYNLEKEENQIKGRNPPNIKNFEGKYLNEKVGKSYEVRFEEKFGVLMLDNQYFLDYQGDNKFVIWKEIEQIPMCLLSFLAPKKNIPLIFTFFEPAGAKFQIYTDSFLTEYTRSSTEGLNTTLKIAANYTNKVIPPAKVCPRKLSLKNLPIPLPSDINNTLEKFSQEFDKMFSLDFLVNGFMTVSYKGKVIHEHGSGYFANGVKPTINTKYRICSITKIVSTIAALIAEKKGLISLDKPIGEIDSMLKITAGNNYGNEITLRQLMNHQSGLAREAPWDFNFDPPVFSQTIIDQINKLEYFVGPSNDSPSYSNVGFLLLGRIIESKTGMSFEEFTKKYIFDPLKMEKTGWDVLGQADLAIAKSLDGKILDPSSLSDLKVSAPAGQLYSSSGDFAVLINCLVNDDCDILPKETKRSIFLNSYAASDLSYAVSPAGLEQFFDEKNRVVVHTKGGNLPNYNTIIIIIPELELTSTIFTAASLSYKKLLDFSLAFESELVNGVTIFNNDNKDKPIYPEEVKYLTGVYKNSKNPTDPWILVEFKNNSNYLTFNGTSLVVSFHLLWIKDLDFQVDYMTGKGGTCQLESGWAVKGDLVRFSKLQDRIQMQLVTYIYVPVFEKYLEQEASFLNHSKLFFIIVVFIGWLLN